jgi:hypothetical protein
MKRGELERRKLTRTERLAFFVSGLAVLALTIIVLPAVWFVTLAKYAEDRQNGGVE